MTDDSNLTVSLRLFTLNALACHSTCVSQTLDTRPLRLRSYPPGVSIPYLPRVIGAAPKTGEGREEGTDKREDGARERLSGGG
eukprot:4185671-Pyramimonas_sp.AAC.1